MTTHSIQTSKLWFTRAVLGLNLCPFAHKPARERKIRWQESQASSEAELLEELIKETSFLEKHLPSEIETSLLVIPKILDDFYNYQFFLEEANYQLKQKNWEGIFQLASFHPDYCFAGSDFNDPANLTNRSPYPIIHILREDSLSAVLDKVEKPEEIPENNIKKLRSLKQNEIRSIFSFSIPSHEEQSE